jgi:hypothetical protein
MDKSKGGRKMRHPKPLPAFHPKSNIRTIQVSIQDIWDASRSSVHRNKKKYSRKIRNRKYLSE